MLGDCLHQFLVGKISCHPWSDQTPDETIRGWSTHAEKDSLLFNPVYDVVGHEVVFQPLCVRCLLFYAGVKLANIPISGYPLLPGVVMGQL